MLILDNITNLCEITKMKPTDREQEGETMAFLFSLWITIFFLLNSSHAEILKVLTWFYSLASGTYCH